VSFITEKYVKSQYFVTIQSRNITR